MKKNTLVKALACSLSVVALLGIAGCEKGPMAGKKPGSKPMPPKERRMSEPAARQHPRESKGMYPQGQGEPRMKQHSDETHQRQDFQSEPHPPQRQQGYNN